MPNEQDRQALERLDYHIRSASSLAQILLCSGDAPAAGSDDVPEQPPNFAIATLNNLAQSLVRAPDEVVAVGLPKGASTVVVGSSRLRRPPGTRENEGSGRGDTEELSGAVHSTKLSPSTSPRGDVEEVVPDKHKIFEMAYLHHTLPPDTRREQKMARLDPRFSSHAKIFFQLYKESLRAGGEVEARRSSKLFRIYVLGMSLARLEKWIQGAERKVREGRMPTMDEFLKSSYGGKVTKDLVISEKQKEAVIALCKWAETKMDPLTEKDLNNNTFTNNVASFLTNMLGNYFTTITDQLQKLHDYPSPDNDIFSKSVLHDQQKTDEWNGKVQRFGSDLEKLFTNLYTFTYSVQEIDKFIKHYVEATDRATRSPTPTKSRGDNGNDNSDKKNDNDDIDGHPGPKAHFTWITGVQRQTRAAATLTLMRPVRKQQFLKMDFSIVNEEPLNITMEPWEQTISQIYADPEHESTRNGVLEALKMIASGSTPDRDEDYQPLKEDKNWKNSFWGAIHCESVIAKSTIEVNQRGPPRLGVSEGCCVTCTLLLEEVVKYRLFKKSINFLPTSYKIWSYALPRDCPLPMAKNIARRLDEKLREMLKRSLPRLEARAEKYASSGSGDRHSGQGAEELTDKMEDGDTR